MIDIPNKRIREIWALAFCNELGRLTQGFKNKVKGTDCCVFIKFQNIPKHKRATYARIVSEIRPQKKEEPHRIRMTAGGNLIYYPFDKSQPTADLTTVKLHINSVISTRNARYACLDIKNMYLNSDMDEPEYMFIYANLIPPEFMDEYNLHDFVHDGKVYLQINKGMYGLPQAGKLAHDQLKAHLKKFGYAPCRLTPGLWKHQTRPISFTLVVDDFGVKYVNEEDLNHLIASLRQKYELHVDLTGSFMLGMSITWDYANRHVDISMAKYIKKALAKFQHNQPPHHQAQPHRWTPPVYGASVQTPPAPDTTATLNAKETKRVQEIVGTFLYLARAVDPTILVALNDISAKQSAPTRQTLTDLNQLLDYIACNDNPTIRYRASDMVLHIHSDGSYLSAPHARSRVAGHYFLSEWPTDITKPDPAPPLNGPIYTVCKTLRNVLASAAETELGALFFNGQEAIPIRHALLEMGHPQPPTPIQTDNTTAAGIVNASIRPKRSKAMDMRFHWMQDRCNQKHFMVYWKPGKGNLADYFSKHHPPHHHRHMRSTYLINLIQSHTNTFCSQTPVQGCVGPVTSGSVHVALQNKTLTPKPQPLPSSHKII